MKSINRPPAPGTKGRKVNPVVTALLFVGFTVKPWTPAEMVAEILGSRVRDMRTLELGTVHGLIEITADSINLVAIGNDLPQNGHFLRFVEKLEGVTKHLGLTLRVCEFWNKRLHFWFVRRGYVSGQNKEFGLHAERRAK